LRARKKPAVYNLSWFSKTVGTEDTPAPIPRGKTGGTISEQKRVGVIILYPALATPEILVGDNDPLEMLLLLQKDEGEDKLKLRITNQLKVSSGLDPEKKCPDRALFVDQSGALVGTTDDRTIQVKKLKFVADEVIKTPSDRFSCFLEKRPYRLFSAAGYNTLYSVSLSSKVLKAGLGTGLSTVGEPHDLMIKAMLDKRSSWASVNGKYYCFQTANYDLAQSVWDTGNPIQSYHPVFHYAEGDLNFANIAHLTDVHVAARQQAMQRSVARVIDTWDRSDTNLDYSPWIGSMVNSCSKVMWELLDRLTEKNPDILLIGGDLVDCLRSCYVNSKTHNDPNFAAGMPWRIWQTVALDKNYTDYYKDGTDMIGFLTLLLNHIRTAAMPAYSTTGNHDCYHLPYGISPRLFASTIDYRANEGIPSDHNLTFYEAILVFGETYAELKSGAGSPFDPDLWDWFYMIYTPFIDFSVELPKQSLVAFGWGDGEDIIDVMPGRQGEAFGHLGRAKDPISDEQLSMLTTAIGKKKRVILMTHFTFVSYYYEIPVEQGEREPGDVYISLIKGYNKCNSGTFEDNRRPVLETRLVTNRDVQIVLTGHSHRRALYLAHYVDTSGRRSIKTLHFDFNNFAYAKNKYPEEMKSPMIVSDSGGTIPRYNYGGEFNGRGSDPPSGTFIGFDQTSGDLVQVEAVRSKVKPRVAVAVDYLDIEEKVPVIESFQSDPFLKEDEMNGKLRSIVFTIKLTSQLKGFWIENLAFFHKSGPSPTAWKRIVLMPPDLKTGPPATAGSNVFAIFWADDVKIFSKEFAKKQGDPGLFLSMKFGDPLRNDMPRYDFSIPWCWEFVITTGDAPKDHKIYVIKRIPDRAEKPNFAWRKANSPKYEHKK
jgi:hypothetical protein